MMSGESDNKKGKGFGGLSDLASRKPEAEEIMASDGSSTAEPEAKKSELPQAWQGEHNTREPLVQSQSQTKSGSGATWTVLAIIGVIIAGGMFLIFSSNQERNHRTVSTTDVVAAAVDAAQVTTDPASANNKRAEEGATDAAQAAAAADAAAGDADAAAGQQPDPSDDLFGSPQNEMGSGEVKPSIGTDNILSGAQLRYCLFEKYRVEGAETQVNQYSEESVDLFNSMVDDFNSRCSSFRYRLREYGPIASEASQQKATLKLEGMQRMLAGAGSMSTQDRPMVIDDLPAPSNNRQVTVVEQPEGRTSASVIQEAVGARAPAIQPEAATPTYPAQALRRQPGEVPEFAIRNSYGNGWTCIRGYTYTQAGNNCVPVEVPANASLNYSGHGWDCNRGYFQAGAQCLPVQVPDNGSLNYSGHGWECNRGFYQAGTQCVAVNVPMNGSLNYSGHGWECNRGSYQAGTQCVAVDVPLNGSLNYSGHGWECNPGYVRSGNQCLSRYGQ